MSNMEIGNRVCDHQDQLPQTPPPAIVLPAPAPVSDIPIPPPPQPPLQQQQFQLLEQMPNEHQAQLSMEQSAQYVPIQEQPGDQLVPAYVEQQPVLQQRQVFIK